MNEKVVSGAGPGPINTLLINSPSRLYEANKLPGERELTPFGLGMVATDADMHPELNVGIMDAEYHGLSVPKILAAIDEATAGEPGVLGMNVLTPTFISTMQLAQIIAERHPELQLAFGGPHPTLDPESVLRHMPQAVVIQGHGERAFSQLAKGIPPEQITGCVFKDSSRGGKTVKGGAGMPNVIFDLNELPWVNRDMFANEPYDKGGLATMTFLGSRGCRGGCTFCITPAQHEVMKVGGAKKVMFRDMGDLVAEVAERKQTHGIQLAQFLDDDLLPNAARVREFLARWEEAGLSGNTEFIALLRPDKIGEFEDLGLMAELQRAGLRKIALGIETGHDRGRKMLSGLSNDRVDPKYHPHHVQRAVETFARHGIETKGFFMLGFPGESRDEVHQTLKYMYQLRDQGLHRVALFPVKVYPATGLWYYATQMGFTPEQLGHYDAPDIRSLIQAGYSPKDASRDGYTGVQLAEVPPEELNQICQDHMNIYNSGLPTPERYRS